MKTKFVVFTVFIITLYCQAITSAAITSRPKPRTFKAEERQARNSRLRTVRLSSKNLLARATQCSVPLYPAMGKNVRVKGTVIVQILIDTEGAVRSARAVSGHPLLQMGAVQAARKWRFKPVIIRGRAARATGLLPLTFSNDKEEMEKQCEGLPRAA
jgi:TonB family protein